VVGTPLDISERGYPQEYFHADGRLLPGMIHWPFPCPLCTQLFPSATTFTEH
jgi:hypothetical protein